MTPISLVAPPGIEPGQPFGLRILSPLRLPFRQGAKLHRSRYATADHISGAVTYFGTLILIVLVSYHIFAQR